jgi:hypothetical protein
MDEQYAFLEELIRRSELPEFKPSCTSSDEELAGADTKFEAYAKATLQTLISTDISC